MNYELDTRHDARLKAKTCDRWAYLGGSSSKHETSSNTINPAQMAQYQNNYSGAQDRFSSLQPYTGPLTAGFNDNQIQAQGLLGAVAKDPRYQAVNQDAINATSGVLGQNFNSQINPQSISANPYTAAQLSGTDLSPYYNPFQKDVIDASIAQNGYARDQQGVKDNAAATAAHAFGGTRQAVQAAETTGAYDRNNQQNIAALNSANFGQAQQAALTDINARNNASQFNAGQNLTAQQFNSGQNLNAQQNSFQNALAAAGFKVDAAGRLQALNSNALGMASQQGGILSAIGDTQQQQEQRGYTDQQNSYYQEFNRRLAEQQALNQALGIIPIEQTNTSDSTTKSNPGAAGILGGIASLGLAAATGGASMGLTGALGGMGGLLGGSLGGTMGSMTSLGSMAGAGGSPFSLGSISSALPKANYGGIFG